MEKEQNFNKNFIWNTIGLSLNAFISLFLLIIVKWVNGSNLAGIFTYSFSISMLFYIICNYYNRSYQVANYNNEKSFNNYFSVRILFSIVSIVLCLLFLFINKFEFDKNIIIILLICLKNIESIADCFFAYFQSKNDLYKSGISYSLKNVLGLLVFFIVDLTTKNLILALISINLAELLVLYFYDYIQYKKYNQEKIKLDYGKLSVILKEAFPIFLFSFSSIYIGNMQKYILTYYTDNEIQMIFGILIMPATVMSLIGSYIIMPFIVRFKNYYESKIKKSFVSLSVKLNGIIVLCGLLCIVVAYFIGIPVLNIIYNVQLNDYTFMLLVILLSAIFNAICMTISNILVVMEKNTIQLVPYLLTSLFGTLLSVILIKQNGLVGSCYAFLTTAIFNLFIFIIVYISVLKKWKVRGSNYEKRK